MAIAVMALTIFALIWLFVTGAATQADNGASIAAAKQAVGKLKDAADLVYTQGPPAQVSVPISVPRDTLFFNASGREIVMTVGNSEENTTAYSVAYANLSSNGLVAAGQSPGGQSVTVAAVRDMLGNVFVQLNASS